MPKDKDAEEKKGNGGSGTTINPPSVHHAAWVKCVSTGEKGDDSLLDISSNDGYKEAWITCRNGNIDAPTVPAIIDAVPGESDGSSCCKSLTAACLACQNNNMEIDAYCSEHKDTVGCEYECDDAICFAAICSDGSGTRPIGTDCCACPDGS